MRVTLRDPNLLDRPRVMDAASPAFYFAETLQQVRRRQDRFFRRIIWLRFTGSGGQARLVSPTKCRSVFGRMDVIFGDSKKQGVVPTCRAWQTDRHGFRWRRLARRRRCNSFNNGWTSFRTFAGNPVVAPRVWDVWSPA